MSIDHELLRRREREFRPRRTNGIAGLVAGAHRDPVLGPWLTLESTLLAPVPVREGTTWTLWSLVSVARSSPAGYQPPWGAVRWSWPDGCVAQRLTLDTRPDIADAVAVARSAPASAWQVGPGFSRARREEVLGRVEHTLTTEDPDLSGLGPLYADLLPHASYPLYHALAPASAGWLHPAGETRSEGPRPNRPVPRGGMPLTPWAPQLSGWLRMARKLSERLASDEATAPVEALARGRGGPFRLAVVGSGRPLYAFVDRILDAPVLPATDSLPPLTVTTGSDRRLVIEGTDGTVEHRPIDPVGWERAGRACTVCMVLDDRLLETVDGELVVVRVGDRQAAGILAGCDAVALITSATAGLGLDERDLLEREVTGRHVPRVAVVVTQLDRVDPEERAEVVDYISARAGRLGVAVAVADAEEHRSEAYAVVALTVPAGREADRALRLTGQLADHLASLREQAERRREQTELEAAARNEAARVAERELDEQLLDWRALRNELQRRANAGVTELRSGLLSYRDDLLDRLMFDLKRSRDPRQWWEEEFPYRLRRDLETTVKRYESRLERAVTADLEWLDGRTRELFDRTIRRRPAARATVRPEAAPQPPIEAPHLSRYRLGVRVAPAVAGLLGVLFLPGGIIAMGLASAAALAAGELKLQGMLAEQRELVVAELPRTLDRAINGVSDELSTRLHGIYAEFADEAERTEQAWRDTELDAIHAAARPPDSPWPQLAADARALHEELRAAIETIGEAR